MNRRPETDNPELMCGLCLRPIFRWYKEEGDKNYEIIGDCPEGHGPFHKACWIDQGGCYPPEGDECKHRARQEDRNHPPVDLDGEREVPEKVLHGLEKAAALRTVSGVREIVAILKREPWLEHYGHKDPDFAWPQIPLALKCVGALHALEEAVSLARQQTAITPGHDNKICEIYDQNREHFTRLSDFASHFPDVEKAQCRKRLKPEITTAIGRGDDRAVATIWDQELFEGTKYFSEAQLATLNQACAQWQAWHDIEHAMSRGDVDHMLATYDRRQLSGMLALDATRRRKIDHWMLDQTRTLFSKALLDNKPPPGTLIKLASDAIGWGYLPTRVESEKVWQLRCKRTTDASLPPNDGRPIQ